MNDALSASREFSDQVQKAEKQEGQELFDEQKFSMGVQKSVYDFVSHIRKNDFLNQGEQETLISSLDSKIGDILMGAVSQLDTPMLNLEGREADDLRMKVDLLSRDATALIDGLIMSVDKQLRAKQTGIEGISDGEFADILKTVASVGEVSVYTLEAEPDFSVAVDSLQGPVRDDLVLRSQLGNETVYLKQNTPSTLLLITLKEPKVILNLPIAAMPNQSELLQKITEERQAVAAREQADTVQAQNIKQVLAGHPEALQRVDTHWGQLDATQRMAIDSAYNMGLDAARGVKMQLLLYKVAQKKNYPLPEKFSLDGDWGPSSKTALREVFAREKIPYSEDSMTRNLQALRDLHHREFPMDNNELFLTAEEINDPRYKFENKGVYRGLKVEEVKTRLMDNGFNIYQLREEGVFDQDISPKVMEAFPRALAVLQKLTSDKDLQASILATMVMETGLSSWKDEFGIGRGDIKDYVSYLNQNLPSVTSAVSAYTPTPLETNSAGVMQVNYKTAQAILKECTGGFYSKDEVISRLDQSVEFSTLMAFMVFQNNLDDLRKAQRQYGLKS